MTLSMLRLHSKHKAQGRRIFEKTSKPWRVGITWIALEKYSQMSTHLPGFQSLIIRFFVLFCIEQFNHHKHKG